MATRKTTPPAAPSSSAAKPPARGTGGGGGKKAPIRFLQDGPELDKHLASEPILPVYLVTSGDAPGAGRSGPPTEAPPSADPQALLAAARFIEAAAMAGGDPSIDHVKVDYIDGDHLAAGIHTVIAGEARSMSLFGGRRVITVSHAETLDYGGEKAEGRRKKKGGASADVADDPLEKLIESATGQGGPAPFVLIFVAERFDRRKRAYLHLAAAGAVVTVTPLDASRLQGYIEHAASAHGIRVDRGVAQRIWDRLGGAEAARLRQTADRLLLDAGPGGHLTVRHVEDVVPMDREAAVWAITDAVASEDLARCIGVLHLLLNQGTEPLAMVGFLASHYRSLMRVASGRARGLDAQAIADQTRLHPFRVKKMGDQLRHMRPGRLEQAVATLAEADTLLKASAMGADAPARWMEQVLTALTRGRPLRRLEKRRAIDTL